MALLATNGERTKKNLSPLMAEEKPRSGGEGEKDFYVTSPCVSWTLFLYTAQQQHAPSLSPPKFIHIFLAESVFASARSSSLCCDRGRSKFSKDPLFLLLLPKAFQSDYRE